MPFNDTGERRTLPTLRLTRVEQVVPDSAVWVDDADALTCSTQLSSGVRRGAQPDGCSVSRLLHRQPEQPVSLGRYRASIQRFAADSVSVT